MQDSEDEYAIGDTGPAGGVIFYIDEADAFPWMYLECAPKPEGDGEEGGEESFYWSTYVGLIGLEAQGTAIGTGEANTQAIIAKGGDGAAKYCSDFALNGYDDWFLPSKDELDQVYQVLVKNGDPVEMGGESYWTSSEIDEGRAWLADLSVGGPYWIEYGKTMDVKPARPIRAF